MGRLSNETEQDYLEIIKSVLKKTDSSILRGIGDDAYVTKAPDSNLVICQDMFIENVHFRKHWSSPSDTGYKAIAVNLSDLAAMNAQPLYASISIALPADMHDWLNAFYQEIQKMADLHKFTVVGGDTSFSEKIVIDINMIGTSKNPVYNNTAKPGDWICTTGSLGEAFLGFYFLENEIAEQGPIDRFLHPPIRLNQIENLSNNHSITSATDISDGLATEIHRLQKLTGLTFSIENLPLSSRTLELAKKYQIDIENEFQNFGEDYELLITLSGERPKQDGVIVIGKVSK